MISKEDICDEQRMLLVAICVPNIVTSSRGDLPQGNSQQKRDAHQAFFLWNLLIN